MRACLPTLSALCRSASGRLVVVVVAALALLVPLMPTSHAATRTLTEKMRDLRYCESSNNYKTNTGNGYYGAYQFALSTWHALGYTGRPDRRSKITQDRAAHKLHERQSWRPWPSCARQEHLYS